VLDSPATQNFINNGKAERELTGKSSVSMRAGAQAEVIVAGIPAFKMFQYLVLGDIINTACRM